MIIIIIISFSSKNRVFTIHHFFLKQFHLKQAYTTFTFCIQISLFAEFLIKEHQTKLEWIQDCLTSEYQ